MLFKGYYNFLHPYYRVPNGIRLNNRVYPTAWHAMYGEAYRDNKRLCEQIKKLRPTEITKFINDYFAEQFAKYNIKRRFTEKELRKFMLQALVAKFSKQSLRAKLKAIPYEIKFENTWHENFWGRCICSKCRKTFRPDVNTVGEMLELIKNDDTNQIDFLLNEVYAIEHKVSLLDEVYGLSREQTDFGTSKRLLFGATQDEDDLPF